MKSEILDIQKTAKGELKDYVTRIAIDLGFVPEEGETVSPALKTMTARRTSDKKIDDLLGKIDDFSVALITMKVGNNNVLH
jgi:hypothetical protein